MRGSTAALITLGAAALLTLPAPALANPEEPGEPPRPRPHRTAEILLDMHDSVRNDREPGGRLRIRKRYGLEYAHRFATGDGPPTIFSIQGPRMPNKRWGLTFELRF